MKDAPQPEDAHLFKPEGLPYPRGVRGLIVPMFTPVMEDAGGFSIDIEGDMRLINHLIDGEADVLFILGNAGMFQKLSMEQKMQHIKTVMKTVARHERHVPVVVGVSSLDPSETATLAQFSEDSGAAALVFIPLYGLGDPSTKTWNVLDNTRNIPLLFYNNPAIQIDKASLSLDFLRGFVDNPRVIGIKNSTTDIETFTQMAVEFTSPTFSVFMGDAKNIAPAMELYRQGVIPEFAGCVPVQANLNPRVFAHLLAGDDTVRPTDVTRFVQEHGTKAILQSMVNTGMLDHTTLDVFTS